MFFVWSTMYILKSSLQFNSKIPVSSDSVRPPQPRLPGFFILRLSSILFLPCRFRFFKASLQCITNGTPPRWRNREMEIPDFSLIKTSYSYDGGYSYRLWWQLGLDVWAFCVKEVLDALSELTEAQPLITRWHFRECTPPQNSITGQENLVI